MVAARGTAEQSAGGHDSGTVLCSLTVTAVPAYVLPSFAPVNLTLHPRLGKTASMQHTTATPATPSSTEFWNRTRVGILLMVGAALLWSTSGVLIKGLHLDAPAIGGVRAVFAGLVLS